MLGIIALLPFLGSTPPRPAHKDVPEISQCLNGFTLDLLKHWASIGAAPANTIFSPQSIFRGLAMSYIASGGETRAELARVLHFPDDNDALVKDLAGLRRALEAAAKQKGIDASAANSAWMDTTHAEFRPEFVSRIKEALGVSFHSVEFSQRDKVSAEINAWISAATRGRIKQGVKPGDFISRSRPGVIDEPGLVILDAVYFKADWGSRFDRQSTSSRPFHVDATLIETVPTMHQHSALPYSENEHFRFLEIPYIGNTFSMCVVLPKEILAITNMLDLITTNTIGELKSRSFVQEVDVLLPKFELGGSLGVKDALTLMGVRSAFDRQTADFERMIAKKIEAYRIYLSEIHHEAWIAVHEEGTEAAAATTATHFSIGCSARPPRADFHADHPFLFVIVHNQSQSILFAGWIANPKGLAH
jgi:serpin B